MTFEVVADDKYSEHLVCLIDLLGYTSLLLGGDESKRNNVLQWQRAIIDKWEPNGHFHQDGNRATRSPIASTLSDTLVFSYPTERSFYESFFNPLESLLYIVGRFPIDFMMSEILWRGAIVVGKIYHKDGRAYGEALAKAAEIERNICSPLIVIPHDTLLRYPLSERDKDWLEPCEELQDAMYLDFPYMIARQGTMNREQFTQSMQWFGNATDIIKENIDKLTDQRHRKKWITMKAVFNRSIEKAIATCDCYQDTGFKNFRLKEH